MNIASVRLAQPSDLDWILALNTAFEHQLSVLDAAGLADLVALSQATWVAGDEGAFLVILDQDAAYDSPNFRWFKQRYDRFLYVDRIAVSASAQGQGLARALYENLFAEARAQEVKQVLAEVNKVPSNPTSDAFHAALGFEVVGEAHHADRGKTVRFMERLVA
ncbi:MAG: GNAT family N-acetyltransferase [Rhodospirillales bacterium]